MSPTKFRVELLDVIRGLAASLVVVHHVLRTTPTLDSANYWDSGVSHPLWVNFAFLGDLAVTVFFVLSGASLVLSQLNQDKRFDITGFYIKRFFRIYPLYALAIFIYFAFRPIYALLVPVPPNDWLSPQFTLPVDMPTWLAYLTMTFNIFKSPTVFSNVLWSLPIEFQFYLFFPLFFALIRWDNKLKGFGAVILLCAISIVLNDRLNLPGQTFARLWEFAGGMIIGANFMLFKTWGEEKRYFSMGCAFFALSLFLVSRFGIRVPLPFAPSNTMDVLFSFSLVVLALSLSNWSAQNTFSRFLVNLGVWSYSIYMLHNLCLGFFVPIIRQANLSPFLHFILVFAIVYPLVVFLSSKVYAYFEKPFMLLGQRLSKDLFKEPKIESLAS